MLHCDLLRDTWDDYRDWHEEIDQATYTIVELASETDAKPVSSKTYNSESAALQAANDKGYTVAGVGLSHQLADIYKQAQAEVSQANQQQAESESTVVNTNPAQHTPAEQRIIDEYQAAVDEDLKSQIERQIATGQSARIKISDASKRQIDDVSRLLNADYSGYSNNINDSGITHIVKRHGKNGEHDESMADINDMARIGYVLDNYDNVYLARGKNGDIDTSAAYVDKNNDPSPKVIFEKKVNGTYYVVEAVPESKWKKFWVVSAYMNKSGHYTSAHDAVSDPQLTPEASHASLPTDKTIPSSDPNVNTQQQSNNGGGDGLGAADAGFARRSPEIESWYADAEARGSDGFHDISDTQARLYTQQTSFAPNEVPKYDMYDQHLSRVASNALNSMVTPDLKL